MKELIPEEIDALRVKISQIKESAKYERDRPVAYFPLEEYMDSWIAALMITDILSGIGILGVRTNFNLEKDKAKEKRLNAYILEINNFFPKVTTSKDSSDLSKSFVDFEILQQLEGTPTSDINCRIRMRRNNAFRLLSPLYQFEKFSRELKYKSVQSLNIKIEKEEDGKRKHLFEEKIERKLLKPVFNPIPREKFSPEEPYEPLPDVLNFYLDENISPIVLNQFRLFQTEWAATVEYPRYDYDLGIYVIDTRRTDPRKTAEFKKRHGRLPLTVDEREGCYFTPASTEDLKFAANEMLAQGLIRGVHPYRDYRPTTFGIDFDIPPYFLKTSTFEKVVNLVQAIQEVCDHLKIKMDWSYTGHRGIHAEGSIKEYTRPRNWVSFKSEDEIRKIQNEKPKELEWQVVRDAVADLVIGVCYESGIDYVRLEPENHETIVAEVKPWHLRGAVRSRLSLHPRTGRVKIPFYFYEIPDDWDGLSSISTINYVREDVKIDPVKYWRLGDPNTPEILESIFKRWGRLIVPYTYAKYKEKDVGKFFRRI